MNRMRYHPLDLFFLACLLWLWGTPAWSARPMITDDARVVDAKACQLESWVRFNRDSREFWALPGCNPTGNLELTVGGGLERPLSGGQTSDVVLQAKTIFRPLEINGIGVGGVIGTVRHPAIKTGSNVLGDYYGYVPVSLSYDNDRLVMHINAGLIRPQEIARNRMTWGVGLERQIRGDTWFIAESFGQTDGRSFAQLGVRQWLLRDRVQVDATWGDRLNPGASERWFSLGLRLLTPVFLP